MLRKVIIAICFVVTFALGILVGRRLLFGQYGDDQRLAEVLSLINEYYVDSLDMKSVNERVLPLVLAELDPHSTYLSYEANAGEVESLEGSFQGIGVMFNLLRDTVVITRVIEGGGAERAGVRPGDRVLRADTTSLVGAVQAREDVTKYLKGPSGSVVSIEILRSGERQTLSVVRGPVPVSSVSSAYMMSDSVLYVRLNKWGSQTYIEFFNTYVRYQQQHPIGGLVLDLRDNVGGYLESAIQLASEFLPSDKEVVYTEGNKFPRESYVTPRDGILKDLPLVVLVNENSASSSEVFAGAIQDHDRGLVVGRRTFGKGLVQRPFVLGDSSVVRLTVARYYTPSGRSIQRRYDRGRDAYAQDIVERYVHGELFSADSIAQTDTTTYYTAGGRVVHGQGGITPDVFVPRDTSYINSYYHRLVDHGMMVYFGFDYADKNREKLSSFASARDLYQYLRSQTNLLYDFAYYAQANGVPIRTTLLQRSSERILVDIYSVIAFNVAREAGADYEILNELSQEVRIALGLIQRGQWRPDLSGTKPDLTWTNPPSANL